MVTTIGSLVQETCNLRRWLTSAGVYAVACITTSACLGATLAVVGRFFWGIAADGYASSSKSDAIHLAVTGTLALAYAMSDVGLVRLPRPRVMEAVPVSWWRRWQPYGSSLLYGAALGFGVTTRIPFGGFYIISVISLLSGSAAYGALLMGIYGFSRAVVIFPATWIFGSRGHNVQELVSCSILSLRRSQQLMARALAVFGAAMLGAALLPPH